MMQLESMIKIREGKIEEVVKKYNIDAVVNCANPSLMGSKSNVNILMRQSRLSSLD